MIQMTNFIIIDWTTYTKNTNILIAIKNNEAKFSESEITEYQSKNLVKEFKNLNFTRLKYRETYNIEKPLNTNYSVLLVELNKKGTEINFEIKENKNKDDNKGLSILYIILIIVFGLILIIVILFLIFRYFNRKDSLDITKTTTILENVKLMNDI